MQIIFLVLTFLFTNVVFAIESLPEYQVLQTRNRSTQPRSVLIDSEYQSDLLTYMYPFSWYVDWLNQEQILQLSSGSISRKRFAIENRLKLQVPLSEKVKFSFYYFDQSHIEIEEQGHIIDLETRISKKLSASIFGETQTYKSENAFGLALNIYSKENNRHRIYTISPNFDYNKRNEESDYYAQKPHVFGYHFRKIIGENFLEIILKKNLSSKHIDPTSSIQQSTMGETLGIKSRSLLSSSFLHLDISQTIDQVEEVPFQSSNVLPSKLSNKKREIWIQLEKPIDAFGVNSRILFGIQGTERTNTTLENSISQIHILPHGWWYWKTSNSKSASQEWGLGGDITYYAVKGPTQFRSASDTKNNDLEYRANVSYLLGFETGQLRFLFTFDLDRFGQADTWEGGAAQLSLFF